MRSAIKPLLWLIFLTFVSKLSVAQSKLRDNAPWYVEQFTKSQLIREASLPLGFESIEEFSRFYSVPQHYQQAASHELSSENIREGGKSHKAWVYRAYDGPKAYNNNHRAYPTIQLKQSEIGIITSQALVEFWVWVDADLSKQPEQDWLSLATLSSYSDIHWSRSYLVNIDHQYRLHLMHVPNQGEQIQDIESHSVTLPRREWAKLTIYIDYSPNNRFQSPLIALWHNETLVSAARLNDRVKVKTEHRKKLSCLASWDGKTISGAERHCNLHYEAGLAQAHFGLYAPPKVNRAVVYNDALTISRLNQSFLK